MSTPGWNIPPNQNPYPTAPPPQGSYPQGGVRFVDRRVVTTGEKVKDSVCGAVFGIVLFLVAFPVLFWNEGRAVETHKMLMEGLDAVVVIPDHPLDPKYEGDLVHINSILNMQNLRDNSLDVSANTVFLHREVEMLQWKETRETTRKKDPVTNEDIEETRTSYSEEWSSSRIDSKSFRDTSYHNPPHWPIQEANFRVQPMKAGPFELSNTLVEMVTAESVLNLNSNNMRNCRAPNGGQCFPQGEYVYFTQYAPRIGDIRVKYEYHAQKEVSIVAQQKNGVLVPWRSKVNGKELSLLENGHISVNEMFDNAVSSNNTTTWILRFVGFIMMFFGLTIAVDPILKIVGLIPLFGGFLSAILGIGSSIAIGIFSFSMTLLTIAVGWLFYRPMLALTLIAVGLAPLFFTRMSQPKGPQSSKIN